MPNQNGSATALVLSDDAHLNPSDELGQMSGYRMDYAYKRIICLAIRFSYTQGHLSSGRMQASLSLSRPSYCSMERLGIFLLNPG